MANIIKKIILENYCGYKNIELDFSDSDNLAILYGPNGVGKTTLLQSISMLSAPWQWQSRPDMSHMLRKLTYNPNYIPGYEKFNNYNYEMKAELLLEINGEEKLVIVKNKPQEMKKTIQKVNGKKIVFQENEEIISDKKNGIIRNDLSRNVYSYSYWIDADNFVNLNTFQLSDKYKDIFIDLAEAVYGFKCELPEGDLYEVEEHDTETNEYIIFYTDFIIHKKDKYNNVNKTHFKSMSAGEKKIAKLLSYLCDPLYIDKYDIFIIDNIEQSIYFRRHMLLIQKIREHFFHKQIIATTHSGVIVKELDKKHLFDLETI